MCYAKNPMHTKNVMPIKYFTFFNEKEQFPLPESSHIMKCIIITED